MKKLNQRHALFASTMLCGAALLGATQANAQAAAAAAAPADSGSAVTEVVVTGSRIPHANLESASPLTIVSAGEVKAEQRLYRGPQDLAARLVLGQRADLLGVKKEEL